MLLVRLVSNRMVPRSLDFIVGLVMCLPSMEGRGCGGACSDSE